MYQQPLELKKTGVMYEHWIARVHPDDKVRSEEALNAAIERRADYDLVFRIILPVIKYFVYFDLLQPFFLYKKRY